MAVAALVPLEEYLSTTYSPDREYIDGRLVERHVGERDHSYLQYLIAKLLDQRGLLPFTELRVQVAANRYRVPDVIAERQMPRSRFMREPPYIVVEILSREDRDSEMAEKIHDYLTLGVENIWVVDPLRHRVSVHTPEGAQPSVGRVETIDGQISIAVEEIFGHMPPVADE